MSGLNDMLKQAQKMQRDVEKAQEEIAAMEIAFSNNGVDVIANGDSSIKSVSISDDLIASGDKELLEDVVLVAVNGALSEVRQRTESKLSGIAAGLNIPGLM